LAILICKNGKCWQHAVKWHDSLAWRDKACPAEFCTQFCPHVGHPWAAFI
jgi:hypothetical protein